MDNFTYKIKNLKRNRDKQVKKLSKLLNLLVSTEWQMVTSAYEQNDKTSMIAYKSLADAAKSIQSAISQLILAEFSEIEKQSQKKYKQENICLSGVLSLNCFMVGKMFYWFPDTNIYCDAVMWQFRLNVDIHS